jgi:hypothetical protein
MCVGEEGPAVTEIYRGQQGHPTPSDREAGPVDETDATSALPVPTDWQDPENAEAVLEDTRAALQQAEPADDDQGG